MKTQHKITFRILGTMTAAMLWALVFTACSSDVSSSNNPITEPGDANIDDSVDGDLRHGELFTITGTDFGLKAEAAPLRWDDFQDGDPGTMMSDASNGGVFDLQGANDRKPFYADEIQRHDGDISALQRYGEAHDELNASSNQMIAMMNHPYTRLYATWWAYRHDWNGMAMGAQNVKLFGNFYTESTANRHPQSRWDEYWTDGGEGGHLTFVDCELGGLNWWRGAHPRLDEWIRVERYMDMGDLNTPNGHTYGAINLEMINDYKGVLRPANCGDTTFDSFLVGHYYQMSTRDSEGTIVTIQQLRQYISEMYIDTTPQRIEIGDAPNWDDCTHREIQIPTEWSDTEITFEVNRGSFSSGDTVYLFVVNEAGEASQSISLIVD